MITEHPSHEAANDNGLLSGNPPPTVNPKKPRRERDFYETPEWVVSALIRTMNLPKDAVIYDPCAGKGAILDVYRKRGYTNVSGADIFPRPELTIPKVDFLARSKPIVDVDLCVMNPPFTTMLEFVNKGLSIFGPRATVAIMMKEDTRNAKYMREHMRRNPDIFPLSPRPSFTGGPTDFASYSWVVFVPGPPRPFGRARVLYKGDVTQGSVGE